MRRDDARTNSVVARRADGNAVPAVRGLQPSEYSQSQSGGRYLPHEAGGRSNNATISVVRLETLSCAAADCVLGCLQAHT